MKKKKGKKGKNKLKAVGAGGSLVLGVPGGELKMDKWSAAADALAREKAAIAARFDVEVGLPSHTLSHIYPKTYAIRHFQPRDKYTYFPCSLSIATHQHTCVITQQIHINTRYYYPNIPFFISL